MQNLPENDVAYQPPACETEVRRKEISDEHNEEA